MYLHTAQASQLLIKTAVPAGAVDNSGSFHLYALSNRIVPEPATTLCPVLAGALGVVRRRR